MFLGKLAVGEGSEEVLCRTSARGNAGGGRTYVHSLAMGRGDGSASTSCNETPPRLADTTGRHKATAKFSPAIKATTLTGDHRYYQAYTCFGISLKHWVSRSRIGQAL